MFKLFLYYKRAMFEYSPQRIKVSCSNNNAYTDALFFFNSLHCASSSGRYNSTSFL